MVLGKGLRDMNGNSVKPWKKPLALTLCGSTPRLLGGLKTSCFTNN